MSSLLTKKNTATAPESFLEEKEGQKQQYSFDIVVSPKTKEKHKEFEEKKEVKNNSNNNNNKKDKNDDRNYESFDDMGLRMDLLRGIYANGFEKPSYIQQKGIIPIISGKDTIAQAQSGSGKTATFSIGCLQRVRTDLECPQILIISPTRELSLQSYKVISNLAQYLKGLGIHCCIGGTSVAEDIKILKNGNIQIVIGTPGRINHMISSNILNLNNLISFVLDEADEMLSRGFKEQIYSIFQYLPNNVQVILVSATMPNEILLLTEKFMRSNCAKILLKNEEITLDGLAQYYIAIEKEEYKFLALCDLYTIISITQCIIFCNSKRKVNWLADQLKQNNFTVSFIHSGMKPIERKEILTEFRNGFSRILISTDLLARGIDISNISLVINYDLPKDKENYIHRIGRAARYGKKGCSINFVTDEDENQLLAIETFYSTKILELPADVQSAIDL